MAGGLNLYAYAGGDPVNRTDPWGLYPYPDGIPTIPSVKELGAWAPFCRTSIGATNPCHRSMAGGMSASFDGIAADAFASIADEIDRNGGRDVSWAVPGLTYPTSGITAPTFGGIAGFVWSLFDPVAAVEAAWDSCSGGFSFSCGVSIAAVVPIGRFARVGEKVAGDIVEGVFGRATAGAAQLVRVLQTGGQTMRSDTARALNDALGKSLRPRDWGRALEKLKRANLLPGDHHGQIWSDGTYADRAGNVIDNITGYLP
jgi:hypothetical protein